MDKTLKKKKVVMKRDVPKSTGGHKISVKIGFALLFFLGICTKSDMKPTTTNNRLAIKNPQPQKSGKS
jgi:hypothetical protein